MDGKLIVKVDASGRAVAVEWEDEHGERQPLPMRVHAVGTRFSNDRRMLTTIECWTRVVTEQA